MIRRSSNEKAAFTETTAAYNKELQAALSNRRAEMDDAWDTLDVEWKKLEKVMAFIGITKPVSLDGGVVHLNVGGEHLNVCRAVLESIYDKNSQQRWTLANLFDVVWDSRVPRDKGGRIFLDESPVIIKYLVHTQLKASTTNQASGESQDLTTSPHLPSDQRPYLQYVSNALELHDPSPGMQIIGGSTMLKNDELARLSVYIRSWCPGDPQQLELIYRGSRDGFSAAAFHAKCTDNNPSTITLVKVDHGGPNGTSDGSNISSVVGGFSSVSWTGTNGAQGYYQPQGYTHYYYYEKKSPDAFIFMAKDGSTQGEKESQPVVWALLRGPETHAIIRCGDYLGPDFGVGGYRVGFYPQYRGTLFYLGDKSVSNSSLRDLGGKNVSEIEVYSVCVKASVIASDDMSTTTEGSTTDGIPGYTHTMNVSHIENTRLFGASIAGALMEEGMALHDAQIEIALVEKKIEAAAGALETMYGPDIATGKPDPVVELDVRGTRMTTLRSTLQACSESALAARFDDSKWPSDGKDFGVIDCSPLIFSKVLDVLRMRKRARWSNRDAQKQEANMRVFRVMIASGNRAPFEEFVGMYFPGCEAYVMDWVTFEGS